MERVLILGTVKRDSIRPFETFLVVTKTFTSNYFNEVKYFCFLRCKKAEIHYLDDKKSGNTSYVLEKSYLPNTVTKE